MAEHVLREVLHVLRVDLGPAAEKQRPDLDEAAPADGGARRGAEVDALFHELGRRTMVPGSVRVVRTGRTDQAPDVLRERLVQEDLTRDRTAQLDDAFL